MGPSPSELGVSHQLPGREAGPALSQGPQDLLWMFLLGRYLCSRPPQALLLQGFGEPSCSPAAVLGSGRLMETFIPISSSPSPGCLPRNASCSPHACSSSLCRYLVLASQHGTAPGWGMPNPKRLWTSSSGRTSVSPGGCGRCPLLPGDRVCMGLRELAAVPCVQNQWGCRFHIAEIPKLLGQFHTQAGVWGMLSCCPLGS